MGHRMRERLIIVFIALAIGLLITTLLFFLYQQTKITNKTTQQYRPNSSAPKAEEVKIPLSIDDPSDFSISDRRTIQVRGKTNASNTIIVSTNQEDVVSKPASDGKFSVSITIDSGANVIVTRAITPDGEETSDTRVITYSTEEF
jgi:hypothetical protein